MLEALDQNMHLPPRTTRKSSVNDYKQGSTADTVTTATSYSQSLVSSNPSFSHEYDDRNSLLSTLSRSYDRAHLNFIATQDTKSLRLRKEAIHKEKENSSLNQRPPIPRSARSSSPFHSRLAESETRSSALLRLERIQTRTRIENERANRNPFYTVSKANSFSDSTISSVSMISAKRISAPKNRVSSSLHNRLAEVPTISYSLRLQQESIEHKRKKEGKVSNKTNRKPFYTVAAKSKEQNIRAKSNFAPQRQFIRDSYLQQNRSLLGSLTFTKHCRPNSAGTRRVNNTKTTYQKRGGTQTKGATVYDRLAYTGTASSLQKNRNSLCFKEEYKTLGESCQNALLREFKGSTFVPVARGRVNNSVIGSVVHC